MSRYGSIFAGAGLLDLGLHETCPALDCRFAVEVDDDRRRIFGAHFPAARLLADVVDVAADAGSLPTVDGLIGGIPCNMFSTANVASSNSRDIAHGPARHALTIFARLQPRWSVWESSGKGRTWSRWVPPMRRELRRLGHASVSVRMRTAPRGSAHDRERAFVFSWRPPANPDRHGEPSRAIDGEVACIRSAPVGLWDGSLPPSFGRRVAHGSDIVLARAIGYGVDQRVARDVGRILGRLLSAL